MTSTSLTGDTVAQAFSLPETGWAVPKTFQKLHPFQKEIPDFATLLRMKIRDTPFGAYVLKRGDELKFIFAFSCKGVHSCLPSAKVNKIFDKLEAGLKDIPLGERITFHLGAFSSDSERQKQLAELIENAPNDDLRFLLTGQRARIQKLAKYGLREPKSLTIYCTYTISKESHGARDVIEKTLARLEEWWHSLTGSSEEFQKHKLTQVLKRVFTDGAQRWLRLLTNKMGLQVTPLNEKALWSLLWKRFNCSTPIPPIPQLLIFDKEGVREEIASDAHPVTLLIGNDPPIPNRRWTYVNDRYIGALTFISKPGGWSSKLAELRYLWDVIARDDVIDTEIFAELSTANQAVVRTDAQRLMKQSNIIAITATKRQSLDVGAQIRFKRTVAAQERMYEGETAIRAGVIILVHRKTLDDLQSATDYLETCFHQPAWVAREEEYAWKLWVDTLPINWHSQLSKPYDRRKVYLTSEVLGITPLICTNSTDQDGLEFLAEDGGTPIFVDLFNHHKNIGIFGATRCGKSCLMEQIFTHAQARNWPLVVLDFPKEDGSSTFSDYTRFVGGSYFDVSKECLNLFERPDLRQIESSKRRERLEDYKDFLLSALLTMVVGKSVDETLIKSVRSILSLALTAFFNDPEINRRYDEAEAEGFGSRAHFAGPTLKDFLGFCSPERISIIDESDTHRALQFIRLSLQSWLETRAGRAISNPSTVRSDSLLLVFALRNLSSDDDAAIFALAAYAAAKRCTLRSPNSIFVLDEGPILFQYDEIAAIVGREFANGAKAGKRVVITGQDAETIYNSVAGPKIFANMSVRLIGVIEPAAVPSFERIFQIPNEIIAENASEDFFPKKDGIYSRWLVYTKGIYTVCRYYPSLVSLAVVANNPDEQEARTWFLENYPDKYEAISLFADYLVSWIQTGRKPFPISERNRRESILLAS